MEGCEGRRRGKRKRKEKREEEEGSEEGAFAPLERKGMGKEEEGRRRMRSTLRRRMEGPVEG